MATATACFIDCRIGKSCIYIEYLFTSIQASVLTNITTIIYLRWYCWRSHSDLKST